MGRHEEEVFCMEDITDASQSNEELIRFSDEVRLSSIAKAKVVLVGGPKGICDCFCGHEGSWTLKPELVFAASRADLGLICKVSSRSLRKHSLHAKQIKQGVLYTYSFSCLQLWQAPYDNCPCCCHSVTRSLGMKFAWTTSPFIIMMAIMYIKRTAWLHKAASEDRRQCLCACQMDGAVHNRHDKCEDCLVISGEPQWCKNYIDTSTKRPLKHQSVLKAWMIVL